MEGFASFRTPTTVDFDGADYFALVGPTGSGKSTVIDAMVFALFGSAPRWGRVSSVQYALAPTANRATVRLVFDAGNHRYQVAREVRRYGAQIQQKGAALERFLDPTRATADTDEVTVVASDVRSLTPAVEKLLGLSFDDFTKAVVLPQGKFAEFLSAKVSERQDILLKLLGAHQYDLIMQAAGRRQADARTRIVACDARLDELRDATPEAEEAAAQRATELAILREQVGDLDHARNRAAESVQQKNDLVRSIGDDVQQLTGLRAPDGLRELRERSEAARVAVQSAREVEAQADQAYEEARADLEDAGDRTELQLLQNAWTQLEQLEAARPKLADDAAEASAETGRATTLLDEAEALKAETSQAEVDAKQMLGQAVVALENLRARRHVIAGVRAPEGVKDLVQRLDLAADEAQRTAEAVVVAEANDERAQAALAEAGDPVQIDRLLRILTEFDGCQTRFAELRSKDEGAIHQRETAQQTAMRAEADLTEARDLAETASVRHAAAELRTHLAVGDECPVCTQVITKLPEVVDSDEMRQLKSRLRIAESAKARADREFHAADLGAERSAADLKACSDELAQLKVDLADGRSELDPVAMRVELATAEERIRRARDAAAEARRELTEARKAREQAWQTAAALENERAAARAQLDETRRALVRIGAPVTQLESIRLAWEELTNWAQHQLEQLDNADLPTATTEHQQASSKHEALADELSARQTAYKQASAHRDLAMRRAAATAEALQQADHQVASLTARLASAATPAEIAEQLAILRARENAEKSTRAAQKKASADRAEAESARAAVDDELSGIADLLRETRDQLIHLGAPPLDMSDLSSAWIALTDWAQQARQTAQKRQAVATSDLQAAIATLDGVERNLLDAAAEHQVIAESPSDVVRAVSTAVELAQERLGALRDDLVRRSSIERDREDAEVQANVAGMLADRLSARKFQRWLAGAALDVLVDAASESLFELSGKQFSLTHDKGEFYVIDHADADAKRSTRTLSGGETFQASLALALALSAELSSISSGAARLDSIFLDEGFGSLDPDSLETVAVTLERLAQGDRMVGVVTHVQALAERVPTRFRVNRTSRSSVIEREG